MTRAPHPGPRALPLVSLALCARAVPAGEAAGPLVRRFASGPIITPAMLPGKDGGNINGPSLIRVPDWVAKPLGRYYLYFAHHGGAYIRLAYADRLEGPWSIHAGGVLELKDAPGATGHIASPDLIIDEGQKTFRLYFHGPAKKGGAQSSFVATSGDGLRFSARPQILGPSYFRVFRWQDAWFALAKSGSLWRSPDGLQPFTELGNPFAGQPTAADAPDDQRIEGGKGAHIRHVGLDLQGDRLWVYHTRIGDSPERIQRQLIDLGPDPKTWRAGPPQPVLRPEEEWEGSTLPLKASESGAAKGRENALRDPGIHREGGRVYLAYAVAGEKGIALAELTER